MQHILSFMDKKITEVTNRGCLRKLDCPTDLIDFSSNDYFGWSSYLHRYGQIKKLEEKNQDRSLGATGSRLISGNSHLAEELEKEIAHYHQSEGALLFSSGYMANLGLFSSLGQKGDTIIVDEYIHASTIDGCRLSMANKYRFKHNDVDDLHKKLSKSKGKTIVAIESLYSMDGDFAPIREIVEVCLQHNAALIVDEAHALGSFGSGRVQHLGFQHQVFARIFTYGKALGCHGAAVVGNDLLMRYLINFCRTFIYSTAMPIHQLLAIKSGYSLLPEAKETMAELQRKCRLFNKEMDLEEESLASPIKTIITPGNKEVMAVSLKLRGFGFDVKAIRSPTVPEGLERLRICLHTFNTDDEITTLCSKLRN